MCLIVQYGVSEAVAMKPPVFLRSLTLSGWFDGIGILYSSIALVATFKTAKIHLQSARKPKMHYCHPHKLFTFFFFSKPSAKIAVVGTNVIPSLYVSVSVHVPLIARKRCCLRVSSIEDLCTLWNAFLYRSNLSGYANNHVHKSTTCNRVLELLCWSSWLSILSYWPSFYCYWPCRVPLTALLSHYPCKIVDLYGYMMASLEISVSAVLSYSLYMHHVALL